MVPIRQACACLSSGRRSVRRTRILSQTPQRKRCACGSGPSSRVRRDLGTPQASIVSEHSYVSVTTMGAVHQRSFGAITRSHSPSRRSWNVTRTASSAARNIPQCNSKFAAPARVMPRAQMGRRLVPPQIAVPSRDQKEPRRERPRVGARSLPRRPVRGSFTPRFR